MLTLGFDTSNYATSLAVFDAVAGEVVCDCKRFLPVKAGQAGLRQSEALFHHTMALPELLPDLLAELAAKSPQALAQVGAVGVSAKPRPVEGSYMPCFLAGVSAATAFSAARGLPLCSATHQQGHVAAALFAAGDRALFHEPVLVFHVSGGTTDLLLCRTPDRIELVGTSTDLYAGQAVDRLGVKLGFAFPAGVEVSRMAAQCAPGDCPAPKCSVRGTSCSLSGLENQCTQLLAAGYSAAAVCRYCLQCVAQTLLRMAAAARAEQGALPVVFAGGVMSSALVQEYVTPRLPNVRFVPAKFASDNAIGIAILAAREAFGWPNISM